MKRKGAWFEAGIAILVIAIGAGITIKEANKRQSVADKIASMPARERNLAVFDAATALLKTHYYDTKYFSTAEWRELESGFRKKAAAAEPLLLYVNVLDNFAHEFPDSHVFFAPPPQRERDAPSGGNAVTAEQKEKFDLNYEHATSGPGFAAPEIRRGLGRPKVVDDVLRGSPAERAGVTPGWILLKDSINVTADHALYAGEFLEIDPETSRGIEKTGQLLLAEVSSGDEPEARQQADAFITAHTLKLEFELEGLSAPTDFETRQLPGGITYLRFDVFESLERVEKALDAIDGAGPGGLIVDLRRNPGGLQLHLQRVAGALLGKGAALGTRRVANVSTPMSSMRFTGHYRGPLVVLIGPSTASAAEITAAAVQDQKRGKLIGRTTNGSVVPAQWFDLPDGGKMMIPMSDFLRSDGRRIEGHGVEPDIWVLPTLDDVRAGRDPVLERALRELGRS